jgi:SpoIID/LytB domain protein
MMEAEATGGSLRLVNQLDVETYLTGMGEVLDPSWPAASLETQEVAARTYALRAMAAAGELCDDTRCQVYLGTAGEYPAAEGAVAATRGEVLAAGDALADTVYSANAAGYSASPEEGFGSSAGGAPYLRAAPYPTGNPMPWSVSVATVDVASALGLASPVTGVGVTSRGPSGRALTVAVQTGSATTTVSGVAFAAALGLRSTLFSARLGQASAPPPQPRPSSLQVPPELAGSIAPPAPAPSPASGAAGLALGRPPASPTATQTGAGDPVLPIAAALAALLLLATAGAALRSPRWRPGARG